MVMVDQVVIDAGQAELGWLLTLQGDPPAPLFSAPANVPGSSLRPCSHLVDPRWLAVALGYVKEMEALSTRRSEVAKAKTPGSPPAPGAASSPPLSRKQQRAKLWAEKGAAAQPGK